MPPDLSPSSFANPVLSTPTLSSHLRYILDRAPTTQVRLSVPLSRLLDLGHRENQRYILQQAADVLDVPLSQLLALTPSRQQQRFKRPRLNSDLPMSSPFPSSPVSQDVQEKSPITGLPQAGNDGRGSYAGFVNAVPTSGWTSSRLADCLSSFAMCPPCSSYETPQPGMVVLWCSPFVHALTRWVSISCHPANRAVL